MWPTMKTLPCSMSKQSANLRLPRPCSGDKKDFANSILTFGTTIVQFLHNTASRRLKVVVVAESNRPDDLIK